MKSYLAINEASGKAALRIIAEDELEAIVCISRYYERPCAESEFLLIKDLGNELEVVLQKTPLGKAESVKALSIVEEKIAWAIQTKIPDYIKSELAEALDVVQGAIKKWSA